MLVLHPDVPWIAETDLCLIQAQLVTGSLGCKSHTGLNSFCAESRALTFLPESSGIRLPTLSSVDLSFPPKPVHLSELCERCGEGNGRSSESNLLVLPKLCFDVHRSLLKTTSDLSLHCGSPAVSAHCLFVDAVAFSPGCPNACAVQF